MKGLVWLVILSVRSGGEWIQIEEWGLDELSGMRALTANDGVLTYLRGIPNRICPSSCL